MARVNQDWRSFMEVVCPTCNWKRALIEGICEECFWHGVILKEIPFEEDPTL